MVNQLRTDSTSWSSATTAVVENPFRCGNTAVYRSVHLLGWRLFAFEFGTGLVISFIAVVFRWWIWSRITPRAWSRVRRVGVSSLFRPTWCFRFITTWRVLEKITTRVKTKILRLNWQHLQTVGIKAVDVINILICCFHQHQIIKHCCYRK